jgi:hypothetical protein
MTCEQCQTPTCSQTYDLFDYCRLCSRNLCPVCTEKGCCGRTPALTADIDRLTDADLWLTVPEGAD